MQLAQQPSILHCDDRLSSKVLQQGDLLFGEQANLLAERADVAQQHAVLPKRHGKIGAHVRAFNDAALYLVIRLQLHRPHIWDLDVRFTPDKRLMIRGRAKRLADHGSMLSGKPRIARARKYSPS